MPKETEERWIISIHNVRHTYYMVKCFNLWNLINPGFRTELQLHEWAIGHYDL